MNYGLGYFELKTPVFEPLEIRSAQKCYLRLRYVVLPMCPGWTLKEVVGASGFEPPTSWSRTVKMKLQKIYCVESALVSVQLPPLNRATCWATSQDSFR